ncbi:MAG TPA: hypothetical protein VLQ48_17410 [Chloroflexia bacterium]|nr:hypothetical protein [Chloroflexia bacterium]
MSREAALENSPQEIAVAGLVAGSAFLGAMWLDNKLSSWQFNDLKLVGQAFTTRSPIWQAQGLAGHFGFSVVMAYLYARVVYPRLPGPGWLRGIMFLQIENAILYPATIVADKVHAGIRSGQVPPMTNMNIFKGQVVRHIAFGATLGLLLNRKK